MKVICIFCEKIVQNIPPNIIVYTVCNKCKEKINKKLGMNFVPVIVQKNVSRLDKK